MANKFFAATSITGGASGALDNIPSSVLTFGDVAIVKEFQDETADHVTQDDSVYFYRFANVSNVESSPKVITPDDSSGAGRWLLLSPSLFVEDITIESDKKIITSTIHNNGAFLNLGYSASDINITSTNINFTKDTTYFDVTDFTVDASNQVNITSTSTTNLTAAQLNINAYTVVNASMILQANGNTSFQVTSLDGGTPFIDFTNAFEDTDARIILLSDNNLEVQGVTSTGFTVTGNYVFHEGNTHDHTGASTGGDLSATYLLNTSDTLTGNLTVTEKTVIGRSIEVGGSVQAGYIDFKNVDADDYDVRFILTGDTTLNITGVSPTGLTIDGLPIVTTTNTLTMTNKNFGTGSAAPLTVQSGSENYIVTDFNADLLDGYHVTDIIGENRGFIQGLEQEWNSGIPNGVKVNSGRCVDSNGNLIVVSLSSITRYLTGLHPGTGAGTGGRLDGATDTPDDTWFYVWAFCKSDGTDGEIGMTKWNSVATLPTGYAGGFIRRIGSVLWDNTNSRIYPFVQEGNEYQFMIPKQIVGWTTLNTGTDGAYTVWCPPGRRTMAKFSSIYNLQGTIYLTAYGLWHSEYSTTQVAAETTIDITNCNALVNSNNDYRNNETLTHELLTTDAEIYVRWVNNINSFRDYAAISTGWVDYRDSN